MVRDLNFKIWGLVIKFEENYFFLENYVTLEGAVSHNVLCHQPRPITRHLVRFYANNFVELLPIMSTAFKPGSYFLWMQIQSECWCHKFATNNLQQFDSAWLTCKYCCEGRVVTSNSRKICIASAFAGSMNWALCSSFTYKHTFMVM